MESSALSFEEVTAFLQTVHPESVEDLEPLGGGWWSSAWGYRVGGDELVVRFGPETAWYEADQRAATFAGPNLPVPEVREVGRAPDGRAYAISVRHRGRFLEDTPVALGATVAATLTDLLRALRMTPGEEDVPVHWHQPDAPRHSWRQFLLSGLDEDPGAPTHGWGDTVAADPDLAALAAAVTGKIRTLAGALPERRDLVHGDLLHGNVLVSPDARRVQAVFSWKCSVRGDFLYDAAWCTFWAPWHEGIVAADPLRCAVAASDLPAEEAVLCDAAARHHCYELHIGFTHLGWNIFTGNRADLDATARRLRHVVERGPLSFGGGDPPAP